jgi:hypothetical protein
MAAKPVAPLAWRRENAKIAKNMNSRKKAQEAQKI